VVLQAGDELIASGPDEGREMLAQLLGWELSIDHESGGYDLEPLDSRYEAKEWDPNRLGDPVA
jgi:hypothetical protein